MLFPTSTKELLADVAGASLPDTVTITVPGTPGATNTESGQPTTEPSPTTVYSGGGKLTVERIRQHPTAGRDRSHDAELRREARLRLLPFSDSAWSVPDFDPEVATVTIVQALVGGGTNTRTARVVRIDRHPTMVRLLIRFDDLGATA